MRKKHTMFKVCRARNRLTKWDEGSVRTRTKGGAILCLRSWFVFLMCKQASLPSRSRAHTLFHVVKFIPKSTQTCSERHLCVTTSSSAHWDEICFSYIYGNGFITGVSSGMNFAFFVFFCFFLLIQNVWNRKKFAEKHTAQMLWEMFLEVRGRQGGGDVASS